MATYLKQELYGQGVLGEVLTGNKNFRFQNDGDYSIYFTLESNKNSLQAYDSTSQKVTCVFSIASVVTEINLDSIVESDYKFSVVVPPGVHNLKVTPNATIPANSYRLRATGEMTRIIIS